MQDRSPQQIPEEWDAIANTYDEAAVRFTGQFAEDALRLVDLQPGEKVIDVAAGTGALSLLAARQGAEVLATDFSHGMIEVLRAKLVEEGIEGVRAEVMDGQNLVVPDESFDAAFSVMGLIFFPDIPKGLRELRRVLRTGGRAAVVSPGDPQKFEMLSYLGRAVQTAVPDFQPPTAPPWAKLSVSGELEKELTAAGFRDVEVHALKRFWRIESSESMWDNLIRTIPALAYLFDSLDAEQKKAVGRAFVELLRSDFGEKDADLSVEIYIGVGVK